MSLSKHINDDFPHAVAELADGLVTSGILPGVSVLVLQDTDEVLYHEVGLRDVAHARPMTRNAIFRLFSMTKPVTAAAVMTLVEEGRIGLQDPLGDWVPELADLRVHPTSAEDMSVPAHPARIQHLLTHTAGFSYWFHPHHAVAALYADDPGIGVHERWRFDPALGGLDGLAESLARLPLVAQPGEKWHYSMAFEVAGMVVERAAGQPLDKFMAKRLFEPLGMKDTAFSVPPGDADRLASLYGPRAGGGVELLESGHESPLVTTVPGFSGGGGLVSTIDDYSQFAEMLRRGGEIDGCRVLSEDSAREIMTNQLAPEQLTELPELVVSGLGGTGEGLGFGLGGAVVLTPPTNGIPTFPGEYCWGGRASTTFWIDPHNRLTVVAMTQLVSPSTVMLRDRLHSAIYAR